MPKMPPIFPVGAFQVPKWVGIPGESVLCTKKKLQKKLQNHPEVAAWQMMNIPVILFTKNHPHLRQHFPPLLEPSSPSPFESQAVLLPSRCPAHLDRAGEILNLCAA
ncbi:hypothetical protein BS47DRAFT_684397 [Hydnum rufescens UP504]|uniref:Uncharacterized protein n=1 Tax=Hydnum rufescens UP504 TaxID=1448309 RepID=A0A9P6AEK3_9AGAM|nr:hypothetical protein BS47DRAFT_684397 [Hydnum rufescens UP504]